MVIARRFLLITFVLSALAGCVSTKEAAKTAHFRQTEFARLPGWQSDEPRGALAAFLRSCTHLTALAPAAEVGPYGKAGDWRAPCAAAAALPADGDAKAFFETQFVPFQVRAGREPEGLFTGYYEPELRGSRVRSGPHQTPLLARPADLVSVDLGLFRPTWKGQRIAGKVSGEGKLVPYTDRRGIEADALRVPAPLLKPIVWVDDPVDAFFMEIQGSGRIRLAEGGVIRLNFDGQNGLPYTPIGRLLIERGTLPKGGASMQAIRTWIAQNPGAGAALMDENASYIFFREKPIDDPALGPPGAQAVALTPGRSLAVDLAIHGLGVPVFVAAEPPAPGQPPFERLMIAQDTGGAIVGPVRGDVFWGSGPEAGETAGTMKAKGRLFVLVPRAIADSFASAHP
jgi:membrane-bound lytic murein transglycosylase A